MAVSNQQYWSIIKKAFRKNRLALWSLRILYILLFIAVFADFIANEKPIYCVVDQESHYPIFKSYMVNMGLAKPEVKFLNKAWQEINYEKVIYPFIPYSPNSLDTKNAYKGPFDNQNVVSSKFHHKLGTAALGIDVAAGMIHGTRIAMLIGVIAMSIAGFIGILLGSLAGYFGDNKLSVSRIRLALNILAFALAGFYGFVVRYYTLIEAGREGYFGTTFLISLLIIFGIFILANLLVLPLKRFSLFRKKVTIPIDIIVMRLIEIMNSIPFLLLLLAIIAIIQDSSIFYVMIIIGLIAWTGIARFIRAELLRIRQLEYITAAQAMGFGEWRTILRHAIPNAIGPVLITIAFGVAGAIMAEASLSFLGIGVGDEEMSWGKLLSFARLKPTAWWLAILPGMAIFITVTIFNLIGEGLTDALDPKRLA